MAASTQHASLILRTQIEHSDVWADSSAATWARVKSTSVNDALGQAFSASLEVELHWRLIHGRYTLRKSCRCSSSWERQFHRISRLLLLIRYFCQPWCRFHFRQKYRIFDLMHLDLLRPNKHLLGKIGNSLVMVLRHTVCLLFTI